MNCDAVIAMMFGSWSWAACAHVARHHLCIMALMLTLRTVSCKASLRYSMAKAGGKPIVIVFFAGVRSLPTSDNGYNMSSLFCWRKISFQYSESY